MLNNETLDGDHLIALQKALNAQRKEMTLYIIINIIMLSLYFLGLLNLSSLITGFLTGGISFALTAAKLSLVYYYTWEDDVLTLFTINHFGKKSKISFQKHSLKKVRISSFFLSKLSLLKIKTYTKKAQEFTVLQTIPRIEIQQIIKEI